MIGVIALNRLMCLTPFLRTGKQLKLPLEKCLDILAQPGEVLTVSQVCNSEIVQTSSMSTQEEKLT